VTAWRLAACGLLTAASLAAQTPSPASSRLLIEGGRIIADARRPPIENAALLVDRGRIIRVGRKGDLKAPAGTTRVDFTGKTLIPALLDAHVHLGYQVGLNFAAENFNRQTLLDQLNRYAYSGIAAVASPWRRAGSARCRRPSRPAPASAPASTR